MLLLHWQRDPETRKHARSPIVPSEAEHLAWFTQKLRDPDCLFFLAESDGECVGMLRLDRCSREWEVSIIVAPEFRGRGVGKAMLNALEPPGPLVADVLPGNVASHQLFRSCGWRLCDDGRYRH